MIKLTFEFATLDAAINFMAQHKAPFPWNSRAEMLQDFAAPPPAPEPEQPAVTMEQVRAKLADLGQAGKRNEALALLDQFGAKKVTDLDPKDYAAVMAAAEAL